MKALFPACLLILAWLLPAASAQLPLPAGSPPLVTVTVGAFPAPAVPLGTPQRAIVTAAVSCAIAAQGASGSLPGGATTPLTVTFTLVAGKKPEWGQFFFVPTTVALDPSKCDAASQTVPAVTNLTAFVSSTAPAFTTGKFTVQAAVKDAKPNEVDGTADGNITAGFYGSIDVNPNTTAQSADPGSTGSFALTVTNNGNGKARVTIDVTVPTGFKVDAIAPFTLESTAEGGSAVSKVVTLTFHTVASASDRSDPISVKATAVADKDGATPAGTSSVELRVNTVVPPPPPAKKSPGTQVEGVALALVAAALLARRRLA